MATDKDIRGEYLEYVERFRTTNPDQTPMTLQDWTGAADKGARVRDALQGMAVGACAVKWDIVVWRVSEDGFICGETGVRKDGCQLVLSAAVDWFVWKLTRTA